MTDIKIEINEEHKKYFDESEKKMLEFINNDFNTPGLFSVFFDLVRKFNLISVNKNVTLQSKYFSMLFTNIFEKYGKLLGLFGEPKDCFVNDLNLLLLKTKNISIEKLENQIEKRNEARNIKDYGESDKIRDELVNRNSFEDNFTIENSGTYTLIISTSETEEIGVVGGIGHVPDSTGVTISIAGFFVIILGMVGIMAVGFMMIRQRKKQSS